MSREITDTNPKFADPIPEGRHRFIVAGPVQKKYGKKGGEYFVWKLQYAGGIGEQIFLPNMMHKLLRALGCTETDKGIFDWDTTEQEGKAFIATVKMVADKDNPDIKRQHMGDIEPDGSDAEAPPEPEDDKNDESDLPPF